MWPLDVVGLGMRYFHTVFAVKCGAFLRKSCMMAWSKDKMGGLHNLWCINLTSFTLVVQWYEKPAVWWAITGGIGVQSLHGPGRGRVDFASPGVVQCSSWYIGRVHRLLNGSL
jgi:hypothetical protein